MTAVESVKTADQHTEAIDVVTRRRQTMTGFANVEEDFSDRAVGQTVMPFRVEDELRKRGANYVQGGLFKAFVVRDGRLITGQQQFSAAKVGEAVVAALGV